MSNIIEYSALKPTEISPYYGAISTYFAEKHKFLSKISLEDNIASDGYVHKKSGDISKYLGYYKNDKGGGVLLWPGKINEENIANIEKKRWLIIQRCKNTKIN